MSNIFEDAFPQCSGLAEILVDPDNEVFASRDGVLYDKEGTGLERYPPGRPGSFYAIPDGVTEIGKYAFAWNENLTDVTIPRSVTKIGEGAFDNCPGLKTVHYTGSVEEWSEVAVHWKGNDALGKAELRVGSAAPGGLKITAQPEDVTAWRGDDTAVFRVQASGEGLSYQWWFADPGKAFKKSSLTPSDVYETHLNAANDGRRIYCEVTDSAGNTVRSRTATLHLTDSPAIISQPVSVAADRGDAVAFSVRASGDGLTYQWYYKNRNETDFVPAACRKPEYRFTALPVTDGRELYCVVTDGAGNTAASDTVTLALAPCPLTIVTQPEDVTAWRDADSAVFRVEAKGDGLTYQWWLADGESNFRKTDASAADTLELVPKELNGSGWVYCEVTDRYGNTVRTRSAALRLEEIIQPVSQVVAPGEKVVFTYLHTGQDLKYKWIYKDASTSWSQVVSSCRTASYSFTAVPVTDGRQLTCVVYDAEGTRLAQSDWVTLTLKKKAAITVQPESQTAEKGSKATFSVEAVGEGLTYRWYYKDPKAAAFAPSSCRTASYTFTALAAADGRQLYCVVTDEDGNTARSDTVTFSLLRPALAVTAQPESVTAEKGSKVTFSVQAAGDGLTYRWYYKDANAKTFTQSACRSASYTFTALAATDGRQLRCLVMDAAGNAVQSDTATLTLKPPALAVTAQPESVTAEKGSRVTFAVKAAGDGLSYRWYYKDANAKTFTRSACRSASYTFTALAATDGRQLRCLVMDAAGNVVQSDTATLTLKPPALAIVGQPSDLTVEKGGTASFTVNAQGEGLTYRWFYKNASAAAFTRSACTKAAYSFTAVAATNGRQLYCEVTDAAGNTVKTNTVTLT
ncbi:MAG: leucine-rich repeat domain-containing protein, partial [Oscillospiraceae bacterium]|nr:leucine-rich repeat domain-containing protein [Oscillospiraceae bacterium]